MLGFRSRDERAEDAASYLKQANYWDGRARQHAQNAQDGGRRGICVGGGVNYNPEQDRETCERNARDLRRLARRLSR